MARGRRLITFRTLLFVILLAAVLVGAFAAVRWYDINSYFVGVQNNELVIYQGRVGGFLWYHPVEVERTGVTTADVPAIYLQNLNAGVEETSVANARAYVSNLVHGQVQPSRTRRRLGQPRTDHTAGHHDHHQGDLMERRIRRLGIFMLLCFVALFIQLNNIQVLKANSLANAPDNPRVLAAGPQPDPGQHPLLGRNRSGLSRCWPRREASTSTSGSTTPTPPRLFAQIIGFDSSIYGNFRGIEAEYNSYLTPHTPPAKTLRDLLTNRTEVDNVTLTINENLQLQVAEALDSGTAAGVNGAAAVVSTPPTATSRPCTRTRPSIPTRWCPRTSNPEVRLGRLPGPDRDSPLVSGTYDQTSAPGSSFKVVTTSAVLEHRPDSGRHRPIRRSSSVTLPDTGTPPQVLTNYHSGHLRRQPSSSWSSSPATPTSPTSASSWGAPTLLQQAEAYGFNQTDPPRRPARHRGRLDHGGTRRDRRRLRRRHPRRDEVGHRPGERRGHGPADGHGGRQRGQRRVGDDPPSDGLHRQLPGGPGETYQPKQWMQPISAQTAATLTTFMQGVASNPGTAAGVFPASWDVAAKTGTAQTGSFGPNPPFTNDWLIAFAPVGNTKVAIAVVLPNQPGSATGAAYSGPIVKQILGDVLAELVTVSTRDRHRHRRRRPSTAPDRKT